jgi:hypothetical protein
MMDSVTDSFTDTDGGEAEAHFAATRRRHERAPANGRVVAQVAQADDPLLIGLTFHSDILEISACGLRLATSTQVEGCILELWVEVTGHPVRMFLSTEVRWSARDDESGQYHLGVEIIPNPLTDIEEWCAYQRDVWLLDRTSDAT